jgi:hypothetical protein
VTQDAGDPDSSGLGQYFTLHLKTLKRPASSFELRSRWIRSSHVQNTVAGFAMSTLTFAPVPGQAPSCRRDGWRQMTKPDDVAFRNQGACVSWEARHGG